MPYMSAKKEREAVLKVCRTCRHWSDKHKGFCNRLGHGAGQFWMCEDWTEAPDDSASPREKDDQGVRNP
jgi:hypothetical protein